VKQTTGAVTVSVTVSMSVMTTATAATGATTGAAITTVTIAVSVTAAIDFDCVTAIDAVSIIHKAKLNAVRPVLGPVRALIHEAFRGQDDPLILLVRVRTYVSFMYHRLGLLFSVNTVTST
jgi:hypothetical protein